MFARLIGITALLILMVSLASHARAKDPYSPEPLETLLATNVSYAANIPTPADVTGYEVGEIILPHELMVQYVRAIDRASDRVKIEQIAQSHLKRPIFAVYVSSPANLARLDDIKESRSAVLDGQSPAIDIGVHQINYGVHGSEPSSYDSAPLMLYHLAAAQDPETRALLDDNLIILMVTLNPDGASRMANWVNSHRAQVPVAHPAHKERGVFFAGGRTNHYMFDLNRQWLPVAQPEHKGLVPHMQDWLPLLVIDKHEMGSNSTFFFSPAPKEQVNPLFSDEAYEITSDLADSLYEVFDDLGQISVSGEFFPNYYPGYGSSYPTLLGAIPFLFEQSSARGMVQDTVNGLKRYDETISEQFQAAIALLKRADAETERLQDFQQRWFASSREKAQQNATKAYVFTSNDPGRFAHFLDLLNAHDIEVRMITSDLTVGGDLYPANLSAVVSLDQARYALVEGIFGVQSPSEGRVVYYDVSGWTLPHAFGVRHAALNSSRSNALRLGEPATSEALRQPSVPPAPDEKTLAYVIDWSHFYAPRALNRFLQHELRAKVLPNPVTVETQSGLVDLPRGAISIPVQRQEFSPEEIYDLVVKAVEEDGVTVHAVQSSRTQTGSDLGGFEASALTAPKVLLLTGRGNGASGVSNYDAGEAWHYLDKMLHIPVTMIDIADVKLSHLAEHTHLIAVGGSYTALSESFEKGLKNWVQGGGVFIGTQQGAEWAVAKGLVDVEMLGVERDSDDKDEKSKDKSSNEEEEDEASTPVPYEDKLNYDRAERITGAVFASVLDPTHPLGFGYDSDEIFVHKEGTKAFVQGDNPFGLVVRYAEDPLASGYASEANLERLSGQGMLVAERVGQGSVILFADNPNFRAYWLGTKRLFSNSLFFGKAFTRPTPRP